MPGLYRCAKKCRERHYAWFGRRCDKDTSDLSRRRLRASSRPQAIAPIIHAAGSGTRDCSAAKAAWPMGGFAVLRIPQSPRSTMPSMFRSAGSGMLDGLVCSQ
jgi:hypothetical protein